MPRQKVLRAKPLEALEIEGLATPVEVRRHPAARRMTLRVSRTRRAVIVTLPPACDLKQAGHFLSTHLDWVRERLGTMAEAEPFQHGGWLPLRGEMHTLNFIGAERGPAVSCRAGAGTTPPVLTVRGHLEHAPRRLLSWLGDQARADLTARVAWHARRLGVTHGRITVRDQTSRWGSCSSNGNLSFSWRLILAPPIVLDYVAAHEVAHLREMNHGRRFWDLCRKTMPEMDKARLWLDHYGADLHRYGAPADDANE